MSDATHTADGLRKEADDTEGWEPLTVADKKTASMLRAGADAMERVKVLEKAKPATHECFVSHADEHMLEVMLALEDLSFECFSPIAPCNRPTLQTYNRTFEILDRHRKRLFIHPDSVRGFINSERSTAAITETKP